VDLTVRSDGPVVGEDRVDGGQAEPGEVRGRGWALALGLAYLANSASTPDFARLGLATIDAVLADDWAI